MAKSAGSTTDDAEINITDSVNSSEDIEEKLHFPESPHVSESSKSKDFVREYELEQDGGILCLTQKEIGDVNCVVWDAALVLAKYLEKRCVDEKDYLKGKKVVELGSGLGCVGLVAAFYGAHVTLTDLSEALPQLEFNVKFNENLIKKQGGSASVKALDWNDNIDPDYCDVLLLADCVYYKESIPGLIHTMKQLSSSKTEILLTQENRGYSEVQKNVWDQFCDELVKNFKVKIIPQREQHEEYRSGDIYLMHLTKP